MIRIPTTFAVGADEARFSKHCHSERSEESPAISLLG
jgi:hypothetical protein